MNVKIECKGFLKKIECKVKPEDKISVLQSEVEKATKISPENQILLAGSRKLNEKETFKEHGIGEGFTIVMFKKKPEGEMRIFLKTLKNDYFDVSVSAELKIEDLKLKIQLEAEFLADTQRLLLPNGKKLDVDDKSLEDYGIENEAVIILVVSPKPH